MTNYNYVMMFCKDTLNFDELMEPELTEKEIELYNNGGSAYAVYELIKNQCIKDVDFHRRPIFCLDKSRSKFCYHAFNEWVFDHKGRKIISVARDKFASYETEMFEQQTEELDLINIQDQVEHHERMASIHDVTNMGKGGVGKRIS